MFVGLRTLLLGDLSSRSPGCFLGAVIGAHAARAGLLYGPPFPSWHSVNRTFRHFASPFVLARLTQVSLQGVDLHLSSNKVPCHGEDQFGAATPENCHTPFLALPHVQRRTPHDRVPGGTPRGL